MQLSKLTVTTQAKPIVFDANNGQALRFGHFPFKLGNMRKDRDWYPHLRSDGLVMASTDGAICVFNPETGCGLLNLKGEYFPHLSPRLGAKWFQFPAEFVALCVSGGMINPKVNCF